jgi:hypothetical protein
MDITKELYEEALLVVSWIQKEKPDLMPSDDWQRISNRNKAHLSTLLGTYSFGEYSKQPLLDAISN